MIDRSKWPSDIPAGASARDAFLIYIQRGWEMFLGRSPEVILDNDLGLHVLSDGRWELRLSYTEVFGTKPQEGK